MASCDHPAAERVRGPRPDEHSCRLCGEIALDERAARFRAAAKRLYGSDDVEVDEDARVSTSEHGAFVQAWVHVRAEES